MNMNSSTNYIPILLLILYTLAVLVAPFIAYRQSKHVLDTREVRREQTKRDLKSFLDDLRDE